MTWLRRDLAILEQAAPDMPVEDRAADTWEPLVIVAEHAGAHWPDRARAAVLALTTEASDSGEISIRLRLLIDCRKAFEGQDAIPTTVLLDRLRADLEAPWREYGPTGLTAMKVGVFLREYGIRSSTIRFPGVGQAKGFLRADFLDAWGRYCPEPANPPRPIPEGEPYQPYQGPFPRSERYGPEEWYGSSRTTTTSRTSLTSENEAGTAGTATPALRVVGGAE